MLLFVHSGEGDAKYARPLSCPLMNYFASQGLTALITLRVLIFRFILHEQEIQKQSEDRSSGNWLSLFFLYMATNAHHWLFAIVLGLSTMWLCGLTGYQV